MSKFPENVKISWKSQNFMKISKFLENLKISRKSQNSWKSQNFMKVSKFHENVQISRKCQNFLKISKFDENLKISSKSQNLFKISKFLKNLKILWKSQNFLKISIFLLFNFNLLYNFLNIWTFWCICHFYNSPGHVGFGGGRIVEKVDWKTCGSFPFFLDFGNEHFSVQYLILLSTPEIYGDAFWYPSLSSSVVSRNVPHSIYISDDSPRPTKDTINWAVTVESFVRTVF